MKIKVTTRPNGSKRIQTIWESESKTQQQFRDEVDINRIMKKYMQGVPISHVNHKLGIYGDFSNVKDFQSALETVTGATEAFNQLPSHIRNRFSNDPNQLFQFLQNPQNQSEAISLGLMTEPPIAPNANDDLTTNAKPAKAKKSPPPSDNASE